MPYTLSQSSILDISSPFDHKHRRNVIVHLCDCDSLISYGSTKAVFRKYPHANTYLSLSSKRSPGEIDVFSNHSTPIIINAYTQYFFGQSSIRKCGGGEHHLYDDKLQRMKWFKRCIIRIADTFPDKRNIVLYFQQPDDANLIDTFWDDCLTMLSSYAKCYRIHVVICVQSAIAISQPKKR